MPGCAGGHPGSKDPLLLQRACDLPNAEPEFAWGHLGAYRAGWEAEYRGGNDIIHPKGSFRPRIFKQRGPLGSGRLDRGGKPVLQHSYKVGEYFAESQSHAKVGVGIDDTRRGFKNLRLRDDFHLDERPIGQRIDGIHVTPGDTKVADARAHARAVILRKDFCRSDERKSWRTAVLMLHRCLPGTHGGFYTESSPAARKSGAAVRLPFASQCSSTNSVTKTENSKYHLPVFPLGTGAQDVIRKNAPKQPYSKRDPHPTGRKRHGGQGVFGTSQDGASQPARRGHRFGIQAIARTGVDPSFLGDE